ncbi:MAG: HD domain-containing protein [Clostridia bacterium]|nr:HD domain-containing protein [Clostridia bacterium]
MNLKEKFIELYRTHITRAGADELLEYLLSPASDFFTAPASTRFHGAYEGGLCEHSINVYEALHAYVSRPRFKEEYGLSYSEETIAIVSLLHDLCKVNVYKVSSRNVKKDGVWTAVPYYEFDDKLPYGHGEKSVYVISGFMKLTREEAFAIRYHMGFSKDEEAKNVSAAFEMYPLAMANYVADMEATFLIEERSERDAKAK